MGRIIFKQLAINNDTVHVVLHLARIEGTLITPLAKQEHDK